MNLARFQTKPEARTLAVGGPHSRRNLWQPQATISNVQELIEKLVSTDTAGGLPINPNHFRQFGV